MFSKNKVRSKGNENKKNNTSSSYNEKEFILYSKEQYCPKSDTQQCKKSQIQRIVKQSKLNECQESNIENNQNQQEQGTHTKRIQQHIFIDQNPKLQDISDRTNSSPQKKRNEYFQINTKSRLQLQIQNCNDIWKKTDDIDTQIKQCLWTFKGQISQKSIETKKNAQLSDGQSSKQKQNKLALKSNNQKREIHQIVNALQKNRQGIQNQKQLTTENSTPSEKYQIPLNSPTQSAELISQQQESKIKDIVYIKDGLVCNNIKSKSNSITSIIEQEKGKEHLMITPQIKKVGFIKNYKFFTDDKKNNQSPLSEKQAKYKVLPQKKEKKHQKQMSDCPKSLTYLQLSQNELEEFNKDAQEKQNEKTIKYYENLLTLYNGRLFKMNQENQQLKEQIKQNNNPKSQTEIELSFLKLIKKTNQKDCFIKQLDSHQKDYEKLIKDLIKKNQDQENEINTLMTQKKQLQDSQQQKGLEFQEQIFQMKISLNKQEAENNELKNRIITLLEDKQEKTKPCNQQFQLQEMQIQKLEQELSAQNETKIKQAFMDQIKQAQYDKQIEQYKQEITQLRGNNEKLQQTITDLTNIHSQENKNNDQINEKLSLEVKEQERFCRELNEKLRQQQEAFNQSIQEYKSQVKIAANENNELETKIQQLKSENQRLLKSFEDHQQQRIKTQEEQEQKFDSINDVLKKENNELKQEIANKQQKLDELVQQKQELQKEIQKLDDAYKQLSKQIVELKSNLRKTKRENLELEAQYQNIQLEIQEKQNEIKLLEKINGNQQLNLQSQESQINKQQQTLRELRDQINQKELQLDNQESQISSELQKLKDKYSTVLKEHELSKQQNQFLQEQLDEFQKKQQNEMDRMKQLKEKEKQIERQDKEIKDLREDINSKDIMINELQSQ